MPVAFSFALVRTSGGQHDGMRRLAKMMTRRKERMMVKNVPDESLDKSLDKSKSNGNDD